MGRYMKRLARGVKHGRVRDGLGACYTLRAMLEIPKDIAAVLNGNPGGWNRAMGLRFVEATGQRVVAELPVGPEHLQAYGIVHGGVHCGVIETLCSVGAAVHAASRGQSVVGIENHTSFIRAVRQGLLRITATPITRGRRSQVWEGLIQDEEGRTVATGRVRLLCLEAEADLAGRKVVSEA
jgi:1,4-dihydroxy-2-naphthoyl-CoA hydrolase